MQSDLAERIETLAQWMLKAKHPVIFTGAGISTDSGLSDFRGPDGIWTRRARALPVEQINFALAEPNESHFAIATLQTLGKLGFLITQNVDNLHPRSGINPDLIAELHGNITRQRCSQCGFVMDNFNDMIICPLCQGILISSVVDFGQPLPQKALSDAYQHSEQADLFVVVGSSLVVMPAANLPAAALKSGAKLVIINQGETPLDRRAHLRFEEPIGKVLPSAVDRLEALMR